METAQKTATVHYSRKHRNKKLITIQKNMTPGIMQNTRFEAVVNQRVLILDLKLADRIDIFAGNRTEGLVSRHLLKKPMLMSRDIFKRFMKEHLWTLELSPEEHHEYNNL